MSPGRRDPTDPGEWLRRARSNLARARAGRPTAEVLYEDLAFDAQQAAEKAIKAVLVRRRTPFPKTHSLVRLMTLVESGAVSIPAGVREAARLTRYAVRTRYPGVEDVTEAEYREALDLAERVFEWAEEAIEAPSDAPEPAPGDAEDESDR